jgi:GA-binding protein transcription factor beta
MAALNDWVPNDFYPMIMFNENLLQNYSFNQIPTTEPLPTNTTFNPFNIESLYPIHFDLPVLDDTILPELLPLENILNIYKKNSSKLKLEYDNVSVRPAPPETFSTECNAPEILLPSSGQAQLSHSVHQVELSKKLLASCIEGKLEELKNLLVQGAPITTDWMDSSPLHSAAFNGIDGIIQMLIQAGATIDSKTKVDKTPLHFAATEGHINSVQVLVNNGADVHSKDMLMMTPLHWAVQRGHLECVEILIKNGADVHLSNKFNKNSFEIARSLQRIDICDVLSAADSIRDAALIEKGVQPVSDPVTLAAARSIIEDSNDDNFNLDEIFNYSQDGKNDKQNTRESSSEAGLNMQVQAMPNTAANPLRPSSFHNHQNVEAHNLTNYKNQLNSTSMTTEKNVYPGATVLPNREKKIIKLTTEQLAALHKVVANGNNVLQIPSPKNIYSPIIPQSTPVPVKILNESNKAKILIQNPNVPPRKVIRIIRLNQSTSNILGAIGSSPEASMPKKDQLPPSPICTADTKDSIKPYVTIPLRHSAANKSPGVQVMSNTIDNVKKINVNASQSNVLNYNEDCKNKELVRNALKRKLEEIDRMNQGLLQKQEEAKKLKVQLEEGAKLFSPY